jgi:hypothetical protein
LKSLALMGGKICVLRPHADQQNASQNPGPNGSARSKQLIEKSGQHKLKAITIRPAKTQSLVC